MTRKKKSTKRKRKRKKRTTNFLGEPMKLMHTSIKVTAGLTAYALTLGALTKMRK